MVQWKSVDQFVIEGLQRLHRFAGTDHIQVISDKSDMRDQEVLWRELTIAIFTDTNRYQIVARKGQNDFGYLGCTATSRKPRAGEHQHRGRDLADGPLTSEVWNAILGDIVSYEMVRVHAAAMDYAQMAKPGTVASDVGQDLLVRGDDVITRNQAEAEGRAGPPTPRVQPPLDTPGAAALAVEGSRTTTGTRLCPACGLPDHGSVSCDVAARRHEGTGR